MNRYIDVNMFHTVKTLTLEAADEIATIVVKTCQKNGFKPISVSVVDASSEIIVQKRMTGCPSGAFPKFALAKAVTASSLLMPSRSFSAKYATDQPAKMFQGIAMVGIADGNLAPFPGGIVIRDKVTNEVLGAVGVSGAAGDEDEFCALAGVHESSIAAFTTTEPSDHSCKTHKYDIQTNLSRLTPVSLKAEDIKEMFRQKDSTGEGTVTVDMIKAIFTKFSMSEPDLQQLLSAVKKTADGRVHYEELVDFIMKGGNGVLHSDSGSKKVPGTAESTVPPQSVGAMSFVEGTEFDASPSTA